MAAKQILTHPKVRKLQRTLYLQAKSKPKWKAWSLHADLCRKVVVEEAMGRVLRNRGASGVDGFTVEAMEADWDAFRDSLQKDLRGGAYRPSPVKRIRIPKSNGGERKLGIPTVKDRVVQMALVLLMEPIFEAGFHDESYGYRPRRKATDAVGSIARSLYYGGTMALEADLSSYFDTIGHERLLGLVKKRVSDGSILSLLKRFLGVPVVEEDGDGKRRTLSNEKRGVPQGGVISPLLANLYLDRLDHAVNSFDPARVKMVRYADDFVVLIKGGLEGEVHERVRNWLARVGLTLNDAKTKLTDVSKKGRVEFLGFELGERRSNTTGKRYIHCQPSRKSLQSFRDRIREELHHWSTWKDASAAIARVNRITRGWGNYFHYGHSPETFRSLNHWLANRTRTWLAKKHKLRGRSKYKEYSDALLQEEFGLYMLPPRAVWMTR